MGQSNPKDNRRQVKGGIFIQLQKTSFISNEVVQGQLNINIEEPFQGHILQVTLKGLEETQFTYTVKRGKHRRTVFAKGQNEIVNFSMPIYDFAQGQNSSAFIINPCQVVIPFQLCIADKLPSSMNYFYNSNNQCSIKYSIIAQIIPTEANVKPIQGSQEIFIGQQISTYYLSNNTTSIQQPVICCCCKSGQINYNITTSSRCFSPQETINLNMDIDFSQYSKQVNKLTVKLLGQLTMKANTADKTKVLNIAEKSIEVKVEQSKMKQEVQFQVPSDIPLSSQGELVQVVYQLQLIPQISTICCVSDSSPHEIKVFINPSSNLLQNSQQNPPQLQIQAPPNWNPVQLQPNQLNYSQANCIQDKSNIQSQNQFNQYPYQPQQSNNLYNIPNSMLVQIQPTGQPQMINQNQQFL
ncbi:arrestin (macronuclear) [Tetrahymena thermophila SB210]|uniref:Arrestin n=1 Tax=Tetrahymena thermophila (strain SB210) TaxID=312017 RepID=Q240M9_TETTS|nr:arrestin [Tetrahymena thermophila SB210]EAS02236.1 arrestin [Tetrahymena thermophila SB210]|eukprot:XP_001022481.1 arrestin [Tetrahymena thermophila SB210]